MFIARRKLGIISSYVRGYQVTVLGGASEVGQTISLLLRAQPSIKKLVIHDTMDHNPGVVMDISHIPAASAVVGFTGEDTLERALKNSDLVIATGAEKTPAMSKKEWYSKNAEYIKKTVPKIAKTTPFPFVGLIAEPMNSIVPMAAEVMRNHGDYDGRKLFGIATIDALRACCLYATDNQLCPRTCDVPVIGGRSHKTTIPLLSQAKPHVDMSDVVAQEFTSKLRKCDDAITRAKSGWNPALSVSYGVLLFVRGVLDALEDRPAKVNAYVENNDFGTGFFSGLVHIDKKGVIEMQRHNKLSKYECHLLERSIDQLRKDIATGKKLLELA